MLEQQSRNWRNSKISLKRQRREFVGHILCFLSKSGNTFFRQNIVHSGAKSALKEVNPVRLSLAPFFLGQEETGAYVANNLPSFPDLLFSLLSSSCSAKIALSSIYVSCSAKLVQLTNGDFSFLYLRIIITTVVSDLY